ncbi:hypothetical protein JRO89_XS01G0386700 [Xanthoceras sorbifolium]|uniref:Uncharacterized protein n=1 Tax=Xanthoceras sorbifolium TaxID=99658 RepID=A0ABQ8IP63_9ROSI|nr:hypothetical protein JRO89_XS01G0386700 [Xanthoceras sorbifolium]
MFPHSSLQFVRSLLQLCECAVDIAGIRDPILPSAMGVYCGLSREKEHLRLEAFYDRYVCFRWSIRKVDKGASHLQLCECAVDIAGIRDPILPSAMGVYCGLSREKEHLRLEAFYDRYVCFRWSIRKVDKGASHLCECAVDIAGIRDPILPSAMRVYCGLSRERSKITKGCPIFPCIYAWKLFMIGTCVFVGVYLCECAVDIAGIRDPILPSAMRVYCGLSRGKE